MVDLRAIYNAFNIDEPLPASDDSRYVDLSDVWGSRISQKLTQRIKNSEFKSSHHLVMGHTKCGKTTELNRTARLLEKDNYIVISFDVAEVATRTFEYSTVILLIAGQIVEQLSERDINVEGLNTEELMDFLAQKEITVSRELSGDVTGKAEVKPGFLTRVLGEFGLGIELRGGFKRGREITTKIEADYGNFLEAIVKIVEDARSKVWEAGYKDLIVICDGCDKLAISAADEHGNLYDLQRSMFVDHATDLQSIPCHVIYTVPISIPQNLGDVWEQTPEIVPAIPVAALPKIDDSYPRAGRKALEEVVSRRLEQAGTSIEELFEDTDLLNQLIDVSGGHISDLLLLVREAVLDAQTRGENLINKSHTNRSILGRALEYTRLIEGKYLPTLTTIDQFKSALGNSDEYRELIFKRLVLEYVCGTDSRVDLHPLVAASESYRRWSDN